MSPILDKVIKFDVACTRSLVSFICKNTAFKSLKIHGKFLELSCHGIVWLSTWLAFIWMTGSDSLYQMQLNMLVGLIFDIVIIAILKAYVRRRRPIADGSLLSIGPDKFSFPSGHASRSFYVFVFFTCLYPISMVWWLPMAAWTTCVCLSRIALQRHFILDVLAGAALGAFEALFIKVIWISKETSVNIISMLSNDYIPVDTE